jgi:very-short-patch-repair endonuclease
MAGQKKKGIDNDMAGQPEGNQYLLPTLESFRNKLLDLTTRNNLLNLGLKSQRTARLLRFVDCNLHAVLAGLTSGRQYSLSALPEPPKEKQPALDDTAVETALAEARTQDPLYQQILADGTGDEASKAALAQADDRLRAAVLEDLGKASKDAQSAKNLIAWAEQQGINSSYALSLAKRSKGHQGAIRVLLLEPRMERVAEGIRKQAQSSIEETGNNILYLAFGCLEWAEKNKSFFAPLILLPVELTKTANRGGAKTFYVGASDDAPVANVTLRERLKRDFGIELPMLDLNAESVDLEGYFKAVNDSVSELEGWQVHPFLNLALFNFGGLGLYEDLIPEFIQESPLVRQLLAADVSSEGLPEDADIIAEDVHVDQPEIAERVPVLIAQADASQFAAVADVMAGRSMVIEGPPGTGKSQTITNIIANALYAGKRILFVAEKKVALDVVYTRLSEAGLKPYCLRIESDKANKRQVYDELAERIDLPTPLPPRRDGVHEVFIELRQELNGFAALLNQPYGHEEQSQHDLLWQELQLRCELTAASVDPSPHELEISDACSNSRQRIERNSQLLDDLGRLLAGLDREHLEAVFEPLGVLPAEPLSRETLLDQAGQWAAALQAVDTAPSESLSSGDWSLEQLRQSAFRIVDTASRLPIPLAADAEGLLPLLGSPAVAGMAQTLLDALQADAEMESAVSRRFVRRPDPLPSVGLIQGLVAALSQWRIGSRAIPPEQPEREQLRHRLRQAAQASDRLQVLLEASTTGLALAGFSPASLDTLLPLVEHLGSQPDWVLRQRREAIWSAEPERARSLVGEHNALQDLRAQLKLDEAAAQQPTDIDLDQAIGQVQRCCERGLGAVLAEANAAERWAEQLDQAHALLQTADAGLTACMPSDLCQTVSLEQLLTLPELLQAVLALDADAIPLRSSPLWSVDLKALQVALDGEQELQRREQALDEQGLRVVLGTRASALRESADLLEKQPLFKNLLNRLSGTTGRALKLAREICANDPAQRPAALRDVAKVVELQESYGAGWKKRILSLELPSHRLLPIAEQLQSLRRLLETSSHGPVWGGWVREATAEDLQTALTAYGQGLGSTLRALAGHAVWPSAVLEQSLRSLQTKLEHSRQDQALLAAVEPVARWARAAGLRDGEAMVTWLQQVQCTIQRQEQFPQQELQALLASGLEVDQVDAVLSAADRTRTLVASSSLGAEAEALMAADQTALSQAVLTLQHQLAPLVQELMREGDLLPTDANQRPLAQLAKGIQETTQGYQALLQQWQDSGLRPDASLPDLLQLPIDLALAHRRREELGQALASFQQQAGEEVAGTPPELLRQLMGWISALRQAGLPVDVEDQCLKPGSAAFIAEQRARAEQLANALDTEVAAAERFIATSKPNLSLIGGGGIDDIPAVNAKDLKNWLEAVVASRNLYPTWVERHQVLEQLPADGVRRLAEHLLRSSVEGEHWSRLYRWTLVRSQLRQMGQAIPELQQLRSREQVARRERFQRMEEELRALDRSEVVAAIHRDAEALPDGVNRGLRGEFTEMGLILNECRKQKRHRPLRHLFQYAGEALQGLKPCWMMSPGTLASLVPREAIEQFDLVIVDEASQMPPERAFGLISRARQCVVVGDPKQLPPTSFFQRTASVDEADADNDVDTEVLDEESILDLCTKTFHPVRRLKWHYRSRHGSLIAFSNKHFYNSELVVFPSCDRDFAIHRHLVSDARYTKSVNLPEVRLVCDVVLEQLEQYPDRSLGVVAMNEAQASEIGEQLEMLSLHHEELRRRLELKDTSEELFVKSLEKVQGDERDTIVISCTYGPSEPGGPVAMRFGPVNQQGGHRRLNVLFTRAKRAIELVTSIESHQIQPTATSSQGIHAFRNYLKFVESQSLETGRPSGREPDSPFEVVVAEAIQRHGYEVDCQVGVANYFIDLAIRHPDKPDTYLLGVECDGATYHSARAARDRDKYRQAVLEGLGWQIYRIWSTDWFENADTETRRLAKHLRQLQNDRRK